MFPLDTAKVILNFTYSFQTHIQASGRNLTFKSVFQTLYAEEGLFRFWKGSHVMALGCIPSHASYFFAYENLKLFFKYNNDEFDLMQTLTIGCSTTFVHDFFITPSDGK